MRIKNKQTKNKQTNKQKKKTLAETKRQQKKYFINLICLNCFVEIAFYQSA